MREPDGGSVDARQLEQVPFALDPAQRVDAAVLEAEAAAPDDVPHAAGDQNLPRPGLGHGSRGHVDVDAAQLSLQHLGLADMDAHPNLHAELADPVGNRAGPAQCGRGRVEAGEHAVPGGIEFLAALFAQRLAQDGVVPRYELAPAAVAHLLGHQRRGHDVREHQRREDRRSLAFAHLGKCDAPSARGQPGRARSSGGSSFVRVVEGDLLRVNR